MSWERDIGAHNAKLGLDSDQDAVRFGPKEDWTELRKLAETTVPTT